VPSCRRADGKHFGWLGGSSSYTSSTRSTIRKWWWSLVWCFWCWISSGGGDAWRFQSNGRWWWSGILWG
jgi:hypothetical protein